MVGPDSELDMIGRDSSRAAGATLTVDLSAIRVNYRALAGYAAPARVAAVVKADAYGLGAAPVAAALFAEGCREFFVAHLAEGLVVRDALPAATRIYVLNGLQPGAEDACARSGLIPVLNSQEQAERWAAAAEALGRRLPAVIQVDSGMSRLGLSPDETARLADNPALLDRLSVELVMSHLACADEPDHPANESQAQAFETLAAMLPQAPRSLAASAGAMLGARFHYDLIRAGIFLYGGCRATPELPVATAVRVEAPVIQARDLQPGDGVGYGHTHIVKQPARVATLSIGYADGWPRSLSGRGMAWANGVRLPLLGRVSMDSVSVDITNLAAKGHDLRLGDRVELLGDHIGLVEVAETAGSITHEVLARLGPRLERRYVGDVAPAATEAAQ